MAEAHSNTHNKRSLIRTSQVCHRRLTVRRSQQVKEYKHTHTEHSFKFELSDIIPTDAHGISSLLLHIFLSFKQALKKNKSLSKP